MNKLILDELEELKTENWYATAELFKTEHQVDLVGYVFKDEELKYKVKKIISVFEDSDTKQIKIKCRVEIGNEQFRVETFNMKEGDELDYNKVRTTFNLIRTYLYELVK